MIEQTVKEIPEYGVESFFKFSCAWCENRYFRDISPIDWIGLALRENSVGSLAFTCGRRYFFSG